MKEKAVVFVGASRAQLGIDLKTAGKVLSQKPVQLAIDGSSFMPVMANLADDNAIIGTVIVSVSVNNIKLDNSREKSAEWVAYYEDEYKNKYLAPYKKINTYISSFLAENMVTRLAGAKPATVISAWLNNAHPAGNYLKMSQDRSWNADYSKTDMPYFYIKRVQRHAGINNNISADINDADKVLNKYESEINNIQPKDNSEFYSALDILLSYVRAIEKRGGKVFLIRFPTDKLIWDIDQQRYPRKLFWDEIEKKHDRTIHFSDNSDLLKYELPDGSHLDFRDKKSFTNTLMKKIQDFDS